MASATTAVGTDEKKKVMISFKKLLGNVELATTEWSTDTRQPDKATLAAIGAVEAFLPEGLTGKVTLMSDAVMRPGTKDKAASTLTTSIAAVQIEKPGVAQASWDLSSQLAKVTVMKTVDVQGKGNVDLKATWSQKDNSVLLEGTHKPSPDTKLVMKYNTVTGIATTTGTVFVGPKSTYEQTIDSKRAWSATLTHKLTSTDTFKATMTDKADVPTVEWAHALGYGTVSLKMPLRGDAKPTLTAGLVVSVENLGRKNGEKKVTIA